MPIDIEGWVEVKNSESLAWQGVENISTYLIFAGEESDWLFGITKHPSQMSVAANRGLPDDISIETSQSIKGWREFEKEESNFSFEEVFGFSHITYEEIMRLVPAYETVNNDGWSKVFDKMHSLYMQGNFPTDIRVIVWAIW